MYWRYLMWNFTGRQNDLQGEYSILSGNWISGIPIIDELRLGNQSELSEDAVNNKARNTYFFLPFILGLIGLYFIYPERPQTVLGIASVFSLYRTGLKSLFK